jgi:geranylgeranyl diphosphate synthase, type I
MTLQQHIQILRPNIETAIQQFVDRSLPAEYPEIRTMMAYHLGWEGEGAGPEAQGKRIRPLLVLLVAEAAGVSWQKALPAAVSVELLHNFSLIHDDIQDNSPLRRNRPTMWVKWGTAQAINAGDVMFTLAFMALEELEQSLPAQDVLRASRILHQTCLHLTGGQYLDISNENKPVIELSEYWPMIGGKTSALLACCAELGALSAGVDDARRAHFREYGYSLGLAFQVLDDWLGIWGDAELTGKSVESDLASGKKTLPVLYALSLDGPFSRRWKEGSITAQEVPALARMLQDEGAEAYTLETAERLTDQALSALQRAACDNEASQSLHDLTLSLLKRKS